MQPQAKPCGPGEAYRPTSVDILLANPEVALRNSAVAVSRPCTRTSPRTRSARKLAVQYWFFYTFNDFTNKHEGDWEMTSGFTALVDVIAILSGPLLGVLILLLTAQSLTFIDVTGSIVYAMVVPYAAIALTLYYFDLQARVT